MFCTFFYQFSIGTKIDMFFKPHSCQQTEKYHKRFTTENVKRGFKKNIVLIFEKKTPKEICRFHLCRFAVGRNICEFGGEKCSSVVDCSLAN